MLCTVFRTAFRLLIIVAHPINCIKVVKPYIILRRSTMHTAVKRVVNPVVS